MRKKGAKCWGMIFCVLLVQGVFVIRTHCLLFGLLLVRIFLIPHSTVQAEFTEVSVSNCVTILFHVEDCCCFLFCFILFYNRGNSGDEDKEE